MKTKDGETIQDIARVVNEDEDEEGAENAEGSVADGTTDATPEGEANPPTEEQDQD
jgi:hypothetical protein